MIHISLSTADCLRRAGKDEWVRKRENTVTLKGKGEVTTFWINTATPDNNGLLTPINVADPKSRIAEVLLH